MQMLGSNMHLGRYATTMIVDLFTINISEQACINNEREYLFILDGQNELLIQIPFYLYPSFTIGKNSIAIWGGRMLYICTKKGKKNHFDLEDVVHAAYPVNNLWCLVCELSLLLFDPININHQKAIFHHDEIFIKSWWSGKSLYVQDLQNRQLIFQPFKGTLDPT